MWWYAIVVNGFLSGCLSNTILEDLIHVLIFMNVAIVHAHILGICCTITNGKVKMGGDFTQLNQYGTTIHQIFPKNVENCMLSPTSTAKRWMPIYICNSSRPPEVYMRHWTCPSLLQMMDCCLLGDQFPLTLTGWNISCYISYKVIMGCPTVSTAPVWVRIPGT